MIYRYTFDVPRDRQYQQYIARQADKFNFPFFQFYYMGLVKFGDGR